VLSVANAIEIRVTERHVLLGQTAVVSLPPLEVMKVDGTGAKVKRTANDLHILPLADELERKRANRNTALLYVDANTPFRVLIEVLFTLGQSGVERFVLAASSPGPSQPETVKGWLTFAPSKENPPGVFLVLLVNYGFAIKLLGRNVGPGCAGNDPGVAVAKVDGHYDYAGFSRCITSLRSSPEALATNADASLAYLTANPGTPYSELISTIEALHQVGVSAFHFRVPR